jgi:hypothetical protein
MVRFAYIEILIFVCMFTPALNAVDTSGPTIIEDEGVVSFAKQIEESIENRNPSYFNLSFNSDALVSEILSSHLMKTDSVFNKGFTDGIKMSLDLGTIVINELGTNGSFQFIHAIKRNNDTWLVFRLLSENGINYHEYKVEPDVKNYKITDGYFYLSGDKLSESLYHIYEKYVYMLSRSKAEDTEWAKILEELEKIKTLYSEGKTQKAYKYFSNIPETYQTNKTIQCAKINVASGLDHKTYLDIFNEYMVTYPDEPGKYLIPLDGLVSQGCYDLALQYLDSLDNALMTDPLLDFFRATIYYETNSTEKSADYLVKLIVAMPDFETAYLSLLNIYLTQNKFEEATDLLNKMIVSFNTYKEDLYPFLAEYPEYLKSPLYQEWIRQ